MTTTKTSGYFLIIGIKMTLEELTKKYSRKMWVSMISRLKLPINIWDLVRYTQSPVYASSGTAGNSEYIIDTDKCLVCGTLLEIRSSSEYFIASKNCECHNDGGFNWTKDKLSCLISSNERIDSLMSSINNKKTAKFPGRIIYWTNQGYSEQEAELKVSEWQKSQSAKSPSSKKGSKSHSVRCSEYYTKQGFTEEEAKLAVRKVQITNGLEWYTLKYGSELGETLFKNRIDKWLTTYYSKIDIDNINKSKGRTRLQIIDERGLEWYDEFEIKRRAKILATKIEKGYYSSPLNKTEKIIYLEKLSFFTRYSIRNYFQIINPTYEKIGVRDYHIDHLFSKNKGFLEGIPPEVIGNPLNLRAIHWRDNLSKGQNCIITIEQLYENYEKSKITHRYPY